MDTERGMSFKSYRMCRCVCMSTVCFVLVVVWCLIMTTSADHLLRCSDDKNAWVKNSLSLTCYLLFNCQCLPLGYRWVSVHCQRPGEAQHSQWGWESCVCVVDWKLNMMLRRQQDTWGREKKSETKDWKREQAREREGKWEGEEDVGEPMTRWEARPVVWDRGAGTE